eukprot:TRINITY_DN60858_c0_g1_i1.p1 TRINITY_DN60858_c0_g1~~TRINITY_DN60858_c0_g1_i1.p1  ORF type:complete len:255 (-),score=60.57 TRINITY_DN60858_c0_g1_i1:85-849(-)
MSHPVVIVVFRLLIQTGVCLFFFFLMIRRPPRSTQGVSSAASDVYKRQYQRRVHGDVDLAIQIGQALKDVDLYFFEEPIQPDNIDAMNKVARNVQMPLATGERLSLKNEFRAFLDKNAVTIIQPDLAHCHGFGEGLKIAHLADAFSAWVAPHCPMSPVITAISMHLDAVVPNFLIQERLYLNDWRNEVITEPLVVKDGYLELNNKPGWGIELDEALCAAHPEISIAMPRLFRPDGAVCDWQKIMQFPQKGMMKK